MVTPNQDRSHELQTRGQVKRAEHKRKAGERATEIDSLKHSYAKIKDEPAFQDLLKKAKSFAAYHTKMAKDGIGYRDTGRFDELNKPIQEIVYYTNEKRVSELDKAAGIEELEDYILRQLTPLAQAEVADQAEADTEADDDTEDEPVA